MREIDVQWGFSWVDLVKLCFFLFLLRMNILRLILRMIVVLSKFSHNTKFTEAISVIQKRCLPFSYLQCSVIGYWTFYNRLFYIGYWYYVFGCNIYIPTYKYNYWTYNHITNYNHITKMCILRLSKIFCNPGKNHLLKLLKWSSLWFFMLFNFIS